MQIWIVEQYHDNDIGVFSDREAALETARKQVSCYEGRYSSGADTVQSYSLVGTEFVQTDEDEMWRMCVKCGDYFKYENSDGFNHHEEMDFCSTHRPPYKLVAESTA